MKNIDLILNNIINIINNYDKDLAINKICKIKIQNKYITKDMACILYNKYNYYINNNDY